MSQQETKDMVRHFYRASAADFTKIPGNPLAYWVSEELVSTFKLDNVSSISISNGQNKTADNDKYVRFHWEVSAKSVGIGRKWFFYAKGGEFRKWAGNLECIVDWSDQARAHYRKDPRCRIIPEELWELEGITWSRVSSASAPSAFRYLPADATFDMVGSSVFFRDEDDLLFALAALNSPISKVVLSILNPTVDVQVKDVQNVPLPAKIDRSLIVSDAQRILRLVNDDWNSYENAWMFCKSPLICDGSGQANLEQLYEEVRTGWKEKVLELKKNEEKLNGLFIEAYGLQNELNSKVPFDQITLTCNPHYRYGSDRSDEELETLLKCDTLKELVSYAIGCMMGRYSPDRTGLILANDGETLKDYFDQIPAPRFAPDDDAILPLTDQEWFTDDATNRAREFVRVVWGDEHLQENLDFLAESLCLHAIKPKRGESALDTIRRYLSTQFFTGHMRTYKKRPIYWLFSSGKHKAFECLVYLHRYNEGTLARMRTEYVIPLSAKLNAYAEKLEQDKDASNSAAETKRLEKEIATLHKQQAELAEFDEKLRHYADQRISLDLDDGVKVNYGKFGDLLAEVKSVTGQK